MNTVFRTGAFFPAKLTTTRRYRHGEGTQDMTMQEVVCITVLGGHDQGMQLKLLDIKLWSHAVQLVGPISPFSPGSLADK